MNHDKDIALGLGSNVGERENFLRRAIALIGEHPGLAVLKCSAIYETPPWGETDQPAFLNMCLTGRTSLAPLDLLAHCKDVEQTIGRVERRRWGPREIDIDILLYGDAAIEIPDLTIPHAAMLARAFVLVPLKEVMPDAMIGGRGIDEALAAVDTSGIHRLQHPGPAGPEIQAEVRRAPIQRPAPSLRSRRGDIPTQKG